MHILALVLAITYPNYITLLPAGPAITTSIISILGSVSLQVNMQFNTWLILGSPCIASQCRA